jgi:hypothetical protein
MASNPLAIYMKSLRMVFAAMVDLRTSDGRHVLHYSESRWNHGVLHFSPFGGGLQVTDEGKKAVDGLGDITWLGSGDDALDLRLMVPESVTSEVIQWFSNADSSLREHGEGAWRELREELMEETPLLSSLNLEDHVSPLQYIGRFQTEAWSTNPEVNTTSPTVYVFETYHATLSEEATNVLEQQAAEQHPPMALVKRMKEIESIVTKGGNCVDGTPYSVSKDVLTMFKHD